MVLAHREGVAANLDAAKAIGANTRRLLTAMMHDEGTHTPSPRGAPPAMITGLLADSIEATHDGDDALVGPTRLASNSRGEPYARFLELGGTHLASTPKGMRWFEDDAWHKAFEIEKAPRAYLLPATRVSIATGEVGRAYYRHWLLAQEAVTS